jgi:translation initiation factor IF-1
MGKEKLSTFEGVVVQSFRDTIFKVKLENGEEILAHASGKIRKNKIKIIVNDKVTVEMTPYDLTKGRIVLRHK